MELLDTSKVITCLGAGGGNESSTAALEGAPITRYPVVATVPAPTRNSLLVTFETSELLDINLSFEVIANDRLAGPGNNGALT
jgi:hypothetical protein